MKCNNNMYKSEVFVKPWSSMSCFFHIHRHTWRYTSKAPEKIETFLQIFNFNSQAEYVHLNTHTQSLQHGFPSRPKKSQISAGNSGGFVSLSVVIDSKSRTTLSKLDKPACHFTIYNYDKKVSQKLFQWCTPDIW